MSLNDIKVPVEVNPTEDTEWNDILRAHGIIPERPKSPTEELERLLEEQVQKQHENRLEHKTLDELDAFEDEEDEEFLEEYKKKRFEQLQKLQKKGKFGAVVPITKPEYEEEVTKASAECFVFVHMSLTLSMESRLLGSILSGLARTFPEIKFADIPANRCVENYPDSNCPTIMVYHQQNIVKQYITLTQLGGSDCRTADIENVLVEVGAIDAADDRITSNQIDSDQEQARRLRFVKKSIREQDDDEDSNFSD